MAREIKNCRRNRGNMTLFISIETGSHVTLNSVAEDDLDCLIIPSPAPKTGVTTIPGLHNAMLGMKIRVSCNWSTN